MGHIDRVFHVDGMYLERGTSQNVYVGPNLINKMK